jgi:hypothetical protein
MALTRQDALKAHESLSRAKSPKATAWMMPDGEMIARDTMTEGQRLRLWVADRNYQAAVK